MLCSRFLKPAKSEKHGGFYNWSEIIPSSGYRAPTTALLKWSLDHRPVIFRYLPPECRGDGRTVRISSRRIFSSAEDTGQIIGFTESSDRTSFAQMSQYQQEAAAIVAKDPNVQAAMSSVGAGGSRSGVNTGTVFMTSEAEKPAQPRCANDSHSGDCGRSFRVHSRHQRLYAESHRRSKSAVS